jgi:DNA-binding transcriptional ArsR family regulator
MTDIELSKQEIKALLSDTKMQLMNALIKRRKTVSELSEELKLSKSTLLEHLKQLTESGLILRIEAQRKWVYYELSNKGRKVIEPSQNKRIIVLLSLTLIAIIGIAFFLIQFYSFMPTQEAIQSKNLTIAPQTQPITATYEKTLASTDENKSIDSNS